MPIFETLPYKPITLKHEYQSRVMFLDPSIFYERQYVNPKSRFNFNVSLTTLFPKIKGICSCGCGRQLEGRRTRWSSDECSYFAFDVFAIISGRPETIKWYVGKYHGQKCCKCGSTCDLELEHTIPVKHGGGSCWLNNYTLMCKRCHKKKTKQDFGWGREKNTKQVMTSTRQTSLF